MNNNFYEPEIISIINGVRNTPHNKKINFFIWPKGVSSTLVNILQSNNILVVPYNSTSDKYFEMKDSGDLVFTDNNTTVFTDKDKYEKYENEWSNAPEKIKSEYNAKILSRNQSIITSQLFK